MKYFVVLFVFLTLFPSVSYANEYSMGPLPSELLKRPIKLSGKCKNIKIIEWRGTVGERSLTTPSKLAIKTLDVVCNYTLEKFPEFIRKRNLFSVNPKKSLSTSICLMPYKKGRQGLNFRNLNDQEYRFSRRSSALGGDSLYWGFFSRSFNDIYIRNDVLSKTSINKGFMHTFAHELFHALTYHYRIWHALPGDKDREDEKLARDFTAFIGFGKPKDFL